MQGDATGQLAPVLRYKKPPVGRGIVTRKACQFLIEALKAQTEAERLCIFEKKFAGLFDLYRRFRLRHGEPGISHAFIP